MIQDARPAVGKFVISLRPNEFRAFCHGSQDIFELVGGRIQPVAVDAFVLRIVFASRQFEHWAGFI
jgi:hypothetical protein